MNDLLGVGETAKQSLCSGMTRINERFAPPQFFIGGRGVMHCSDAKGVSFMEVEGAEIGRAQARRVRQDGFENRLQFASRAGDDAQHLVGRRLPLQRLTQLALRTRELVFDVGVGHLRHHVPIAACRLVTRLVDEFKAYATLGNGSMATGACLVAFCAGFRTPATTI
jgi:hypothetical protein